MWRSASRKHCSDELLVGHLDGELSSPADKSVQDHLKRCWKCRARLTELEEQAEAFARAMRDQIFPGPARIAEAKCKFLDGVRQREATPDSAPQFNLLSASWMHAALTVAFCILCLGVLGVWISSTQSRLSVTEVLADLRKREQGLYRESSAVHQTFRVEIVEARPQSRTRSTTLELWSEPSSGRFASRWKNKSGALKHAIWRPEPTRHYSYDERLAPGVLLRARTEVTVMSLADLSRHGLDVENIEIGFMKWLGSRRWLPISLAADFALFSGEQNVLLWAKRIRSEEGEVIRITAQRTDGRRRVELILEVDGRTYQPRLHRVRLETAERSVELRLVPERAESVPPARLVPAVFEPDLPIEQSEQSAHVVKPAPVVRREPTDVLAPKPSALDHAEVHVRYTLHRLRVCLGEPVQIVREARVINVIGLAQSIEHKAKLLAALAELRAAPFVKVDIRTIEEGLASIQKPARPQVKTQKHPPAESGVQFSGGTLPIQDELEQYFAAHRTTGDPESVHRKIALLSNEATVLSDAVLVEAWALRRLAERFAPGKIAGLRPELRWLVEVMMRDHVTALRTKTVRTKELLEPLLLSIVAKSETSAADREGIQELTPTKDLAAPARDLTQLSLGLFEIAREMERLVHGLFAGASLREQRGHEAVVKLRAIFPHLLGTSQTLVASIERDFSGNPALVSVTEGPKR